MNTYNSAEGLIFTAPSENTTGVVTPSTLFYFSEGKTHLNGPKKCVKLNEQSLEALTIGLTESGSLIKGSRDEVLQVIKLLNEPESSRTTAHFLTNSQNCSSIINKIAALKNANILVVGCGGIGSTATLLLAGAGVKKITLVDHDTIERSNLNRQLFWRLQDIGKEKTTTLKIAIKERFENTETTCIKRQLDYEEIKALMVSSNYTLAIITADAPINLASQCGELARITGTSIMSGGYLHSHCCANFFSATDLQSDYEIAPNSHNWTRLPESIMPSFGPTNFSIAALLSHGAIEHITTKDKGERHSSCTQWDSSEFPVSFFNYLWKQ
ncbi:ThiF family adenylyltransferase [Pseudomonas sp. NFX98]|uniref:ThiF family adenylyltransferase n=1 Tax=Pseudomonas sp. NFX98 TaxID=3399122 RepID=UPI0039FBD847